MISVEDNKYKVVDKGGYSHDIGSYWKIVDTPEGEKMIVGSRGFWRFWTPKDRAAPIINAVENGWPDK